MIYLDFAATSPVNVEAIRAATPYLTTDFANPSSTHSSGRRAKAALNDARERVAKLTSAHSSEVIFTASGTEAINLALSGISLAQPAGRRIISSPTEHQASLAALNFLHQFHGFQIDWLEVDKFGVVSPDQLETLLRADTTLVSLMCVNNETGTIQPVNEVASICASLNVPFHTDAVQAAGWMSLGFNNPAISALSLSGHKFGAPKGTGALLLSRDIACEPLIHGGNQESGNRSGTENVAWCVAFAEALSLLPDVEQEGSRISKMRDWFTTTVLADVPGSSLTGHATDRHPAIASFVIEGIHGASLLSELDRMNIQISSGSACSSEHEESSHVLKAMGYDDNTAQSAIRISLGHTTSMDELEATAAALQRAVTDLSLYR